MCLEYVWSNEEKEKWLKEQPKIITAYKVVVIKGSKMRPAFFGGYQPHYDRKNQITDGDKKSVPSLYTQEHYVPHYHLYTTLSRIEIVSSYVGWVREGEVDDVKVVKCKVPKRSITDVGKQDGMVVIVAKEFEIVGEDKYFEDEPIKEEVKCA